MLVCPRRNDRIKKASMMNDIAESTKLIGAANLKGAASPIRALNRPI